MISLVLCVGIFLGAVLAANRSLGTGLGFVFAIGYAYGITRANISLDSLQPLLSGESSRVRDGPRRRAEQPTSPVALMWTHISPGISAS